MRHIHTRLNWVWICMTYIHTRLNTILNNLFNIEWINTFIYPAAVWYLHNLSLDPNWDYQNVTAHNWTCHLLIYSHHNWEQKYNWLCRVWFPHGIFEHKNYETVEGKWQHIGTKRTKNTLSIFWYTNVIHFECKKNIWVDDRFGNFRWTVMIKRAWKSAVMTSMCTSQLHINIIIDLFHNNFSPSR